MRRVIAVLSALALALTAGCGDDEPAATAPAGAAPATTAAPEASAAVRAVEAGDAVLLDVRTQEEWDTGHARHATLLPLQDIQAGTRPDAPKDARLYVYCRTGNRAGQAVEILRRAGWTDVENVGGLDDWERQGGAVQVAG